ncbi:MAG TPA: hypothetical protein VFV67_28520 [Actinophytocola sp.]|uniref:hypothetical protein n=1 Tax=Actinophytocola sp. TaxID=1872138 RepID=UPI002DBF61D2|nr:hypothetical protein [Actinophytocola sp.]HEU5474610.1 hypothetical protein [Actinophytocola sp.]
MTDDPTRAELPELPGIDPRLLIQAMAADGVDTSDPDAVRDWLAHSGVEPSGEDDAEDDFAEYEEVSFKELFGLPDRLPPLRLPPDEDLAAAARESRLLALAHRLAGWVGERRPVTPLGEPADCADAARAVGIEATGPVERLGDVPELAHLWELAESVELIDIGDEEVTPGVAGPVWPDGDDEDVLDIWATALAVVMTSLDLDADLHGEEELDFYGSGPAVLMAMFLARNAGVPYAELTELVRESAVGPAPARWDAWVAEHGDPTRVLLARLEELGAVRLDEEDARLTPLAQWAMWAQLMDGDVEVPLLPPVEEMTAAELVAAAEGFTEEELAAETAAWLDLRTPEQAAEELLSAAAEGDPADRMYATSVVTSRIGDPAEPHWRAALDDPRLRAYAKLALAQQPSSEDLAWLLTDVLATTAVDEPEEIARQLAEAVPAGKEQEVFDLMWRLPHPWAGDVLTLLGTNHPDKQIAKAARKAAFKAASHNA